MLYNIYAICKAYRFISIIMLVCTYSGMRHTKVIIAFHRPGKYLHLHRLIECVVSILNAL